MLRIRRRRPAYRRPTLARRYRELRVKHRDLLRHLQLAEQVQNRLLPKVLPELEGVRFAAALRPMQHMAGDFYNVFRLDRDRIGFYVGDVMGHGPAAALMSVYVRLSIRTKRIKGQTYEIVEPGAALAGLNDELLDIEFPGMPFLTLVYGVLDIPRREWTYCCGGHPHPLIVREGGTMELLEPTAPLLGVMETTFPQRSVRLRPGDRLVLYSDGAMTATWGEYGIGIPGLATLIGTSRERPLQESLDDAIAGLSFGDHHPDDVALLAVEMTG